jgi:hypothetical protein
MMRMIYEKAHAVLVWLGRPEDQENARLAFRKIEYFDENRKSHIGKKAFSGPWWWPRKPEPVEELLSSMLARLSPSDKEWGTTDISNPSFRMRNHPHDFYSAIFSAEPNSPC